MNTRNRTTSGKPAAKNAQQPKATRPKVAGDSPMEGVTATAEVLFGNDGVAFINTTEGKKISFRPARMKHLTQLAEFFGAALKNIEDEDLLKLVAAATAFKARGLADGETQNSIDAGAEHLIKQSLTNMGSVQVMFQSVMALLPKIVATLSDCNEEEYGELSAVDGVAVAMGIFSVNYTFFTQSLRPILHTTLGMVVREATLKNLETKKP